MMHLSKKSNSKPIFWSDVVVLYRNGIGKRLPNRVLQSRNPDPKFRAIP